MQQQTFPGKCLVAVVTKQEALVSLSQPYGTVSEGVSVEEGNLSPMMSPAVRVPQSVLIAVKNGCCEVAALRNGILAAIPIELSSQQHVLHPSTSKRLGFRLSSQLASACPPMAIATRPQVTPAGRIFFTPRADPTPAIMLLMSCCPP